MSNSQKITVGVISTAIVIAVSLGFIHLFSFSTFTGWVSYFLLCIIPMEIVASVTWGAQQPKFAGGLSQPAKGIAFVVLCLLAGVIIAPLQFAMAGGWIGPPTPMLVMCTIVSVIITFWLAIMWGGWPFTQWIKNPVAAGLVLLVVCYLLNYGLFRVFFNYDFMRDAPVYVASLDPHGMFNAWNALVFYVSVITVMFISVNFELWPFTKIPALMKQPVLGIVWTIAAFALGGLAFISAWGDEDGRSLVHDHRSSAVYFWHHRGDEHDAGIAIWQFEAAGERRAEYAGVGDDWNRAGADLSRAGADGNGQGESGSAQLRLRDLAILRAARRDVSVPDLPRRVLQAVAV